jgi:hypothetical protein
MSGPRAVHFNAGLLIEQPGSRLENRRSHSEYEHLGENLARTGQPAQCTGGELMVNHWNPWPAIGLGQR